VQVGLRLGLHSRPISRTNAESRDVEKRDDCGNTAATSRRPPRSPDPQVHYKVCVCCRGDVAWCVCVVAEGVEVERGGKRGEQKRGRSSHPLSSSTHKTSTILGKPHGKVTRILIE
jgi:hypothetical protein